MFRSLLIAAFALLLTAAAPNATVTSTISPLTHSACPAGIAYDADLGVPHCATEVAEAHHLDLDGSFGPWVFHSSRVALK